MKLTLFLALVALTRSWEISVDVQDSESDFQSPAELTEREIFDNFLASHNIELSSDDAYEERLRIFTQNFIKIRDHNERYAQGLETFEMAVNQFTHMTEEEREEFTGKRELMLDNSTLAEPEPSEEELRALPGYVNWLNRNIMQPVQFQGRCGSCYAFSAIATIEAQMVLKRRTRVKLSEQEAMECTKGCRGGDESIVYKYSAHLGGCASSRNYPYHQRVIKKCARHGPRVRFSKVNRYQTFRSENAMLAGVARFGPMAAGMDVFDSFYHYSNGVYRRGGHERKKGAHAIVLVGYGVERGMKYWLVRNSWGQNWGQRGYFKIARDSNECNIAIWPAYVPQV